METLLELVGSFKATASVTQRSCTFEESPVDFADSANSGRSRTQVFDEYCIMSGSRIFLREKPGPE
jgi:hypothetical protein